MTKEKTFNPKEHLIDIKGKQYLPVAWRLVWFREEHPDWSIHSKVEERGDGWVIMKATIVNEKDRIIACAHKTDTKANFSDYLEKAETGAIGRALAMCGYGTQFTDDFEEGKRIADAPQERKSKLPDEMRVVRHPGRIDAKPEEDCVNKDKHKGLKYIQVKKEGKNQGRMFASCPDCDYFRWEISDDEWNESKGKELKNERGDVGDGVYDKDKEADRALEELDPTTF